MTSEHEWIHLTAEQLSADPALVRAVERFRAPSTAAGDAATRERFGFRSSLTRRTAADGEQRSRLWMPLFPEA